MRCGEQPAVHGQRAARRHLHRVGHADDQRAQPPHLLLEQAGRLVERRCRAGCSSTPARPAGPSGGPAWCARGRISCRSTPIPRRASCQAASQPGEASAHDRDARRPSVAPIIGGAAQRGGRFEQLEARAVGRPSAVSTSVFSPRRRRCPHRARSPRARSPRASTTSCSGRIVPVIARARRPAAPRRRTVTSALHELVVAEGAAHTRPAPPAAAGRPARRPVPRRAAAGSGSAAAAARRVAGASARAPPRSRSGTGASGNGARWCLRGCRRRGLVHSRRDQARQEQVTVGLKAPTPFTIVKSWCTDHHWRAVSPSAVIGSSSSTPRGSRREPSVDRRQLAPHGHAPMRRRVGLHERGARTRTVARPSPRQPERRGAQRREQAQGGQGERREGGRVADRRRTAVARLGERQRARDRRPFRAPAGAGRARAARRRAIAIAAQQHDRAPRPAAKPGRARITIDEAGKRQRGARRPARASALARSRPRPPEAAHARRAKGTARSAVPRASAASVARSARNPRRYGQSSPAASAAASARPASTRGRAKRAPGPRPPRRAERKRGRERPVAAGRRLPGQDANPSRRPPARSARAAGAAGPAPGTETRRWRAGSGGSGAASAAACTGTVTAGSRAAPRSAPSRRARQVEPEARGQPGASSTAALYASTAPPPSGAHRRGEQRRARAADR